MKPPKKFTEPTSWYETVVADNARRQGKNVERAVSEATRKHQDLVHGFNVPEFNRAVSAYLKKKKVNPAKFNR